MKLKDRKIILKKRQGFKGAHIFISPLKLKTKKNIDIDLAISCQFPIYI